jgi:O-antigen ligase
MNARAWLRSPWPPVVLVLVALTLGVAFAPLGVALGIAGATAGAVLIWKFGARQGLWFLLLVSIPLREPLSIDIVGTASLFPNDFLLLALVIAVASREGFRSTWRESPAFRIGLIIIVLSLPGLVTASRFFWGVTSVYRTVAQVAFLYVARSMVRTGRDAQKALIAVVIGLVPIAVYGLYQASLPFGADLPDWSVHYPAWDALGHKTVRIFSTFRHPLHLAHYLSIGVGMTLGLASSTLRTGHKWLLLLVGAAAAFCNLFTSSIGGLLGMSGAVVTMIVLERRRRIVLLAPVLLILLLVVAPPALTAKLGRVITGQATTGAARMVTYTQSFQVVRDNPILGVGWGSVRSALEHDYRMTRADAVAFAAENYFLQRAVALGIPGLVLSLLLCILFFRNAVRPRGELPDPSWPRVAIITAGVVFYLQGQTFPVAYVSGSYILWLLFALAERMRENSVTSGGIR